MKVEAGTRFADRYVLGAPLGAGGVASVYEAIDERLGTPVAIKVLHVVNADATARLLQISRTALYEKIKRHGL